MTDEKAVLVKNYEECARLYQRALYLSYITCLSLAVLSNDPQVNERIPIPFLNFQASYPAAALCLIGIYAASGFVCWSTVYKCRSIQDKLNPSSRLVDALRTNASMVHAGPFLSVIILLLPALIWYYAVPIEVKPSWTRVFSVLTLSTGHLFTAWILVSCRWNNMPLVTRDLPRFDDLDE